MASDHELYVRFSMETFDRFVLALSAILSLPVADVERSIDEIYLRLFFRLVDRPDVLRILLSEAAPAAREALDQRQPAGGAQEEP